MQRAAVIGECLHAYGIHSITLQPELSNESEGLVEDQRRVDTGQETRIQRGTTDKRVDRCGLRCRKECVDLACCG